MPAEHFEALKKSMNLGTKDPEILPKLLDELRFFFQLLRVQLESGNPLMMESAAAEIKELKELLMKHPLLKNFSFQSAT